MIPRCLILIALGCAILKNVAIADDTSLELVAPGKETVIVVADHWQAKEWSDWGGHLVLQAFLKSITKQVIPIVSASEAGERANAGNGVRIWVGRQPEVEKWVGAELNRLDDDGFLIKAEGTDLCIAGKNWWGSIWAVYDLLETYAGCRWYGPLEPTPGLNRNNEGLFDILPKQEVVKVPADLHRTQEPSYRSRSLPNTPRHSFRQRRRDHFHHNIGRIIDPARYGTEFPELFPLVDGKRMVSPSNKINQWHPVVSHPKALEITTEYLKDYFANNPAESTVSIGMNDGGNFPEEDLALAPPEIHERQRRLAWAWFDFYNKVAANIEREYPDKRLGCLAYATLASLPEGSIKLHRNLVPYLTRDSAQLFDPEQEKEFRDTVGKWNRMTTRMGIYEYLYGGGFLIPRIYNRYLITNIKNRYGVHVDGFYAEVYPNWGLDGPKYWLTAKMLWDNTQDSEKLLEDYYSHLFGPAAGAMRAYFEYLEEVWCTQNLESVRSNYRWFKDLRQFEIFPPEKCDKAYRLLEEAEKKADSETILRRIAFFKETFALTRVLAKRHHSVQEAERQWKAGDEEEARIIAACNALEPAFDGIDPQSAMEKVIGWGSLPYLSTFARPSHKREDYSSDVLKKALKSAVPLGSEITASILKQCSGVNGPLKAEDLHRAAMQWIAENAERLGPNTVKQLIEPIVSTSFLDIPELTSAPEIDGKLNPEDSWGKPLNTRPFFNYGETNPATEVTNLYGGWKENVLYLAFDLKQESPAGANVTEDETGGWKGTKMQRDDSVVITLTNARNSRSIGIRLNVNGAIGFSLAGERNPVLLNYAVERSEQGWRAELALDMSRPPMGGRATEEGGPLISIVRYARTPVKTTTGSTLPDKFQMNLSSLMPMANYGTTLGTGNFPQHMSFKGGSRINLRTASEPKPR